MLAQLSTHCIYIHIDICIIYPYLIQMKQVSQAELLPIVGMCEIDGKIKLNGVNVPFDKDQFTINSYTEFRY